jgi:ankyrin repeat protein
MPTHKKTTGKAPPVNHYPLHDAVRSGDIATLKTLLSQLSWKGGCNQTDEEGDTPLHYAAFLLDRDALNLLLTHGANPMQTNKNGHPPIAMTAIRGDTSLCITLLKAMRSLPKTQNKEEMAHNKVLTSIWTNTESPDWPMREDPLGPTAKKTLEAAKRHLIAAALREQKSKEGEKKNSNPISSSISISIQNTDQDRNQNRSQNQNQNRGPGIEL